MKQLQASKTSGQHHNVNLDGISYTALQGCQGIHKNQSNNFSASVVMRRSLRVYLTFLEGLSEEEIKQETTEALRAAKGIK